MSAPVERLDIPAATGLVLTGVRWSAAPSLADSIPTQGKRASTSRAAAVVIAITGVHGNFHTNPFYIPIGQSLAAAGIDFIYAQTRDALSKVEIRNTITGQLQTIGSWNEDMERSHEDVAAYVDFAAQQGYDHIILAGHSLGANKVIRYLSQTQDPRVERFILLSPANLRHMRTAISPQQRRYIDGLVARGRGETELPFALFGWLPSLATTASQWIHSPVLDNVHTDPRGDFSQVENITHTGALVIGTFDAFTDGDPATFLRTINSHMPRADENEIVLIEATGHTYQGKDEEIAAVMTRLASGWTRPEHIAA
ncbi:MAG: alpha/beta fold hydrolase [Actinomyces urogenitalis]|uniref:alpha/beta fold hydrolase n=1 Tax=Actinomyces urogenitalis TaxID=103621 RepID=UPI002A8097B2|nr:alpha/beta fold hydrolase [Actinomyces urogenitalis]MDY3678241.1 alpha/beta fold hydrolase [Actinomyces urogenitalis]